MTPNIGKALTYQQALLAPEIGREFVYLRSILQPRVTSDRLWEGLREPVDCYCNKERDWYARQDFFDDFRLRGSRTWRRMGGHLSDGGWLTQVAH